LLHSQQIRLIDQQQAPSLPLARYRCFGSVIADLLDVRLEIDTPESEGITSVYDLDDQVGSLEHTPELSPKLNISLKWCHE
jgi:hypothetical protein